MAETGLFGAYALTERKIDEYVSADIGAYALGFVNAGQFHVRYVGRSDDDLNGRLKYWIGSYSAFKYGHFERVEDAFAKECQMFHDFGGDRGKLDNDIHPARPKGVRCDCPVTICTADLD